MTISSSKGRPGLVLLNYSRLAKHWTIDLFFLGDWIAFATLGMDLWMNICFKYYSWYFGVKIQILSKLLIKMKECYFWRENSNENLCDFPFIETPFLFSFCSYVSFYSRFICTWGPTSGLGFMSNFLLLRSLFSKFRCSVCSNRL